MNFNNSKYIPPNSKLRLLSKKPAATLPHTTTTTTTDITSIDTAVIAATPAAAAVTVKSTVTADAKKRKAPEYSDDENDEDDLESVPQPVNYKKPKVNTSTKPSNQQAPTIPVNTPAQHKNTEPPKGSAVKKIIKNLSKEEINELWTKLRGLCDYGKDTPGCFLCVRGTKFSSKDSKKDYRQVAQPKTNRKFLAHHIAYAYKYGVESIDDNQHISHLCGNDNCCNPLHLVQEDPDYNNQRKGCIEFGSYTECPHEPKCIGHKRM